MLLADTTNPIVSTGMSTGEVWMVVLTGLMVLIMAASTFWKKSDVNVQQPLEVELAKRFVEHAEFASFRTQTAADIADIKEIIRVEIPDMERRIGEAGEHRVTKLHERINEVLREVSSLEGTVEQALKRGGPR